MSDIFISYAHEDQSFVLRMAERLQAEGFSVWWDHAIPPGKSWDEVIAAGIANAKACIVVWSKHSVASEWVKEEAMLAREARKYLPVSVDESIPPMGFRLIQAAHLDTWTGDPNDSQWRMLATEARSMLAAHSATSASAGVSAPPVYQPPPTQPAQTQQAAHTAPPGYTAPPVRPAYQVPPVRSATGAAPAASPAPPRQSSVSQAGGIPKPLLVALISGGIVFALLLIGSFALRNFNKPATDIAANTPGFEAPAVPSPVSPGVGALSAESVVASAGQWLAGAPAPANPAGYYMIANDAMGHAGYVGMGSIVSIRSCDTINCRVDIRYGHGSTSCEGWFVIPSDMTYLGATYDPSWQAVSDQLYPRDTHQAELTTRCAP